MMSTRWPGSIDRAPGGVERVRGKCRKGILHRAGASRPADLHPGRSTLPPLDAFNSMVSLAIRCCTRNIIAIERHSSNAYTGFLHQDSRGHATLASDLMEARAPIIDDTVRLIADGVVDTCFQQEPDTGAGSFATREAT